MARFKITVEERRRKKIIMHHLEGGHALASPINFCTRVCKVGLTYFIQAAGSGPGKLVTGRSELVEQEKQ